jgi:hypothetical protein
LSALDATRILELVVGEIGRFPVSVACGSDWVFVPEPLEVLPSEQLVQPLFSPNVCQPGALLFSPLLGTAVDQNFAAVLLGDCTGNWSAAAPAAALRRLIRPMRASLDTPRARPGRRWVVPLRVEGADALEAFQAHIGYDPGAAELERVDVVGEEADVLLHHRADTSGLIALALASTGPLPLGERPLAVLVFSAQDAPELRLLDAAVDDTPARLGE